MVMAWRVPSVQSRCQHSGVGAGGWGTHFGRGPYHSLWGGHHIDAVSAALAILVVSINFKTWWPRPIRGGVG